MNRDPFNPSDSIFQDVLILVDFREFKCSIKISFGVVYGLFLIFLVARYWSTSSFYTFYSIPLSYDTIHISQIILGLIVLMTWIAAFLKEEPVLARLGVWTAIIFFVVETVRG